MNRIDLENQARSMGLEFDDKTTDKKLKELIEEKGLDAQAANPVQDGPRFAEPQGEARFVPVDDEQPEFKKNAGTDNIKQTRKASEKLFPVKLLKNYRPISTEAQIQDKDGKYRPLTGDEAAKVSAGEFVALPVAEAQSVIEKRIAERNDPIR
jgi:hypothetical protein